MTPSDFQPPMSAQAGSGRGGGEPPRNDEPGAEPNPLDELTERVRAAQDAAERLVQDATETAYRAAGAEQEADQGAPRPPPRGYAAPGSAPSSSPAPDLQALVALLDAARGLFPPELRAQLNELIRELLLLLRALIDWYIERLEGTRSGPVEVQDIPIS